MTFKSQFLSLATLSIALTACSGNEENKEVVVEEVLPVVKIEKVYAEEVPQIVSYTATIEPFKSNNITANTSNRIKDIKVDVGQNVVAGQTLVVLDDVNVEQLEVRVANQQRNYERAVELFEIGGGTQQSVEQLKTELDASKRSLKNLKENMELVSPITGVITARNYENGDMTGSLPILTVEDMRPVKVIVNVSENEFPKIKKGMKVEVKLDTYGEEVFAGTVYLIHPTIDAATRTFKVEITVPNADGRIHSGMFARVNINYGTSSHVVVPDLAVVKQTGSGVRYVYTYKDGVVTYCPVELGQRLGNRYELLSGVENNVDVVVSGQTRLSDGIKVKLAETEPAKNDSIN
ncbi:MAG: efflux RND transporter periplasmic adaptor subunit [Bacteroidales bacterium]|nr:efflux RND transporter periplasmic adaptor subunit [Bacteroidales bacterium]